MRDIELLISLIEQALPFLEHRMEESPQPDLVKTVDGLKSYLDVYYSRGGNH